MSDIMPESFKYFTIADIDLTDKPIPAAYYSLSVLKMAVVEYVPKNGPNAGQTKERINAQFAVTEGDYAGRRLFHTFYLNPISMREYRKLAEATGIDLSQPIDVAAEQFATIQPTFKVFVECEQAKDWRNKGADGKALLLTDPNTDKPVMQNRIVFKEATPSN